MSTVHMLLSVTKPNHRWVCSCGERGPAVADWQTARDLHAIHRSKHLERVQ